MTASGDDKSNLGPIRVVVGYGQPAELPAPADIDGTGDGRGGAPPRGGGNVVDFAPPDFSEEAVALFFSLGQHVGLRHVEAWGSWMIWDGRVWRRDADNVALDRARHVCRTIADRCDKPARKNELASKKTAANVLYLTKADRRQAAIVEQWDADPHLVNTPAGIVDVRQGLEFIRPHRPEDYMTKITAVAPGGECPLWKNFLERVTAGDAELVSYLQRMAGYCLTGLTREHALFFLYGTGANGKGVFVNALAGIMGDYWRRATKETFTETKGEHHPTHLAGLRGARLVTAPETEEGGHWAEARIKELTGGDPITARFMREDFFDFTPTFKLLIAGNHRPHLRSVDEAMRRRFHLVPFAVTIPEAERDDQLGDKLRAEWPGILAWMIEGAVEWGLMGLRAPQAVRTATEDYLLDQDVVQQFLDDCCELGEDRWELSGELYDALQGWAADAGVSIGRRSDTRWFGRALKARGCRPFKGTGGKRCQAGIGLSEVGQSRRAEWRRAKDRGQGRLDLLTTK